jgi:toxin ParE1/3/4
VIQFTLRPEAVSDLDSIEGYIATDDVDQALAFIERLFATISLLATQPDMGRARPELRANMRSFPVGQYVVFYEPTAHGVDVVRVLSGARDVDALF